jgi:hypothetical protein
MFGERCCCAAAGPLRAITATSNVNTRSQVVLIGIMCVIIILLNFERVQRSTRKRPQQRLAQRPSTLRV